MKNKTRFQNFTLLALSCLTLTTLACTKSDSLGAVGDGGGTAVFCQLSDGRRVPAGAAYAAEDGCNCCVCTSSGVGECQGAKCSFGDAAVASTSPGGCQSDQDCKDQGSSLCVFDQGCDSPRGTCMSVGNGVCPLFAVSNLAPFPYCGCDGVTYPITNDLQYPYKPYRHVGACGPNDRADGGPSTPDVHSEAKNDGGVDAAPDISPDTGCQYPSDSHVNATGDTVWSWRFHWQDVNLAATCAAWGADAKVILEVDVPANPSGSGTTLPTCALDTLSTGAGPKCAMANAWRFEAVCTDSQLMAELPSSNTFHGYYHVESTAYPNSPRYLVSQDVHCSRDLYLPTGIGSPPAITNDGGVDVPPDSAGCASGYHPYYTAAGCGNNAVPVCLSGADAALAIAQFCACDGVTTVTDDARGTISPYLYAGACKQDGGSNPDGYRSPFDTMPDGADCGGGRYIHYTAPGCGAQAVPLCEAPTQDACAAIRWYCSCDGVTGVMGGCGTSNVPYLYEGACKQDGGTDTIPSKTDAGDPCAACSPGQVCVQSFDGTCKTNGPTCKTVSDACRLKLSNSGTKSCTSLSECQSEFCTSPYQCLISPPCGTEAPQAAIYCYGP